MLISLWNVTVYSFAEARDRLKKIKEERLRRSDEVVELWEDTLSNYTRKLGDEGSGSGIRSCFAIRYFAFMIGINLFVCFCSLDGVRASLHSCPGL